MILLSLALLNSITAVTSTSWAAHHDELGARPTGVKTSILVHHLGEVRSQISALEQGLLERRHSQKNARNELKKIQKLLNLQRTERELGKKRMQELESTVTEMESRKDFRTKKMGKPRKSIRSCLVALESSHRVSPEDVQSLHFSDSEKLEAPRRKVLANLADHGLKEIETLRADYVDAAKLETRIQEEQQQLAYLFNDLKEQEGVLESNRHLRIDFLKKKQQERITQLENYRRLKNAEAQVENLIGQFNARLELERNEETERLASREMMQGIFSKLKGKLPYPVNGGKVVSNFGKVFDAQSGLYVFKKGIDIEVGMSEPVRAIAAGKIAYSGELPHYGQVVIVDHGDHFYSLCAHLGKVSRKASESVGAGDLLGFTGNLNAPLYFEIRARNVAVNPLQWVFN